MFKHVWSVLCRSSVIDNDTNNISLNSVFEQLGVDIDKQAKGNSIRIPIEYEIVSFWLNSESNKERQFFIETAIIDPKGTRLQSFPQVVVMPVGIKRTRARFKIQGLELTVSGNYIFIISFKEKAIESFKKVAEIPLEVKINFVDSSKVNIT